MGHFEDRAGFRPCHPGAVRPQPPRPLAAVAPVAPIADPLARVCPVSVQTMELVDAR